MYRRDVRIYNDVDALSVGARTGGDDGDSRWWDLPSEELALRLAADPMADEDQRWLVVQAPLR
jgi:hypothetical protein